MDYGKVFGRAWEIVWRWKVLWVLGFLAALGQGSSGSNSSNRLNEQDVANAPFLNAPNVGAFVAGLVCLGLILLLVVIVVSTIARGALIAGVAQVEDEGSTSFRRAWSAGRSYFWTLIGIFLLVFIPLMLLVIAGVAAAALVGGGLDALAQGGSGGAGVAGLLGCLCPAICAVVLLAILLAAISTYAERAAILENLGAIDAFKRGWQVLRANLGPSVVLWVIFVVLSILIGVIALVISLPVLLPFVAIANSWGSNGPANLLLVPICGLGLIAFVLGALISSVVTAYTSAVWTLAYRQLTAPPAAPPLDVAPPSDPAPYDEAGIVTTVEP